MKQVNICALADVHTRCHVNKHTHLLTLIDEHLNVDSSNLFSVEDHKVLKFDDTEHLDNPRAPTKEICKEILDWGKTLPKDADLLVHCYAGISRSTAATLALMVQDSGCGGAAIGACIDTIVRIRPFAFPNRLMTKYFDELLGLNGELIQKVNELHFSQREKYVIGDFKFED